MINFNKIKNMPLQQLLIYKDALEALRAKYEPDLVPLFGMATHPNMQTKQQKESAERLAKIKGYLSAVYQEIECTTFRELEVEDNNDNNKELLVENNEQKTNKNVKKNNRKN